MIKLKHILKETLLQEALPYSLAKEYTSIKRNKNIINRLNKIFTLLQDLPNATASKRGDRIYLPFTKGEITNTSPIEKEVIASLPPEYKLKDYVKGVVTDKFGRDVKLNKVLTKIGKSDLVNKVNTDKTRESSKSDEYIVVFSRHPYDIAGMSTDRGWTSCMNLYDGIENKYVSKDVKEGTFICYITKKNDVNLNNPVGRVLIKPFINIKKASDVLYVPEENYYGTPPTGFLDFVSSILNPIQRSKSGQFKFLKSLYCDSSVKTIIKQKPEFQDMLDGVTKPTTKKQVKTILDFLKVKNYTINEDLIVDVNGPVDISNKNLNVIPITFGTVKGRFDCSNNKLTSLEGVPKKVERSFDCSENKLTTLKGIPLEFGKNASFICFFNELTTLEGSPKKIGGVFACQYNKLTTLEGGPEEVGDNFNCSNNFLTSLEGAPKIVGGSFGCYANTDPKTGKTVKFLKSYVKKISKVEFDILNGS